MEKYKHIDYALLDRDYAELNPVSCGTHRCPPLHTARGLRDYYLIHYVESGTGILRTGGVDHAVTAGRIFIIREGEDAMYFADEHDPWSYIYIGFRGRLASRLDSLESPIAEISAMTAGLMRELIGRERAREELAAAVLFAIFADIFEGRSSRPHYVRRATDMINANYMNRLTVESIAETLGLDRRYLSRLFGARVGMSVKDYLTKVRIERAMEHLASGKSVALTAELVGYADAFNFSKMFKKHTGMSPREYAASDRTDS